MLKKAVKWMYSFPLGVMLLSNRIVTKTNEYVKVIINQSGIIDCFFGGFLACISARVSGLNGSIEGSICFASKFAGVGIAGAHVGGASLTTLVLTAGVGVIKAGLGIGAAGVLIAGVGTFVFEEAAEAGLEVVNSLETGLNSLGVPMPFDKFLFKLFVEPWRLLPRVTRFVLDIEFCSLMAMVAFGWKRLVMLP